MPTSDQTNISNLVSLESNIDVLNQAYFKELRASIATMRDSVLVLEKVVSLPGKISLSKSFCCQFKKYLVQYRFSEVLSCL
jgi:hypothetical protein